MTQQLKRQKLATQDPIYAQIWNTLKQFPGGLAAGSDNPPTVSGPAAAAFVSGAIGCFTMMVSHHIGDADKSKTFDTFLKTVMGAWIPGSNNTDKMWGNIGSYTGKETFLLIGWFVSWAILGYLWRNKNIKAKTMLFWFFTLIIAATAMSWHPIFPYLPLT
jgi:hypothetical protein